jgi:sn-glycerol 3-phosphate transport system permease protein
MVSYSKKNIWKILEPYLYLAPAMIGLLLFLVWPLLFNFILSFTDWNFIRPDMSYIGFKNYITLFNTESFHGAFFNTFKYLLGLLPFTVIIPLLLAFMLSSMANKFFRRVYESLLFIPTIISFAIASFVWVWMLHPIGGVINQLLQYIGFPALSWLEDSELSVWSIIMISGWRILGYYLVLFIAALIAIPNEYIEAARIDGSSNWQIFLKIQIPLISPTTFFVILTTIIHSSVYSFVPIHILTKGGPHNATTNLIYQVYKYAFNFFNIGLASGTAVIIFILYIIIAIIQIKYGEKKVHYES